MCKALGRSRDAYYKGLDRRHKKHVEEGIILKMIDEIRKDEPRVGIRKLHYRLKKRGQDIGRDALFCLCRRTNRLVKPKKSFSKTTYSRHSYAVAPNRIKGIKVTAPKQVLVADITYLRLARQEFAYLFLVTDLYSRQIVGFHLSRDLSHYSALLAIDNAVRQIGDVHGTIHHSDRGCQYCCHEYLDYLKEHQMLPSMTDECHCYQNAVAERVNGILKDEFNLDAVFETFELLRQAVVRAILIYNTKRIHWNLGLRTPQEVYARAA